MFFPPPFSFCGLLVLHKVYLFLLCKQPRRGELLSSLLFSVFLPLAFWECVIAAFPFLFDLYAILRDWVTASIVIRRLWAFSFLFQDLHFNGDFFKCWCVSIFIDFVIR